MGSFVLWLTVYPPEATMGSGGTLWTKEVESPFLPDEGDTLFIFHNKKEDEWWCDVRIKRRYWNGDGKVHVELVPYQLCDPNNRNELMERRIDGRYRSAWWIDQDGNLNDTLDEQEGWVRYRYEPVQ